MPDDSPFTLYLYDSDEKTVESTAGSGSEQVTVDTDTVEPGSYVLALYVDGNYEAIQPVVIGGYNLSVAAASEVSPETDVEVDVTIAETALEEAPAGVEVAVWNDETTVREPAERIDGDEYRATIASDELEEGESYHVYAAAQGDEEVRGEPEILGLSHGHELTVDSDGGDSSDGDDDHSSRSGGDDGERDDDRTADSDVDETDETNETNESSDEVDESNETDGVQQPNLEANGSDDEADGADSIPLRGGQLLAIVALLAGIGLRLHKIHR